MDLLSFRSLHDSCVRVQTARHLDLRTVIHADGKQFQKWVKEMQPEKSTEGSKQDFLARYGKGF